MLRFVPSRASARPDSCGLRRAAAAPPARGGGGGGGTGEERRGGDTEKCRGGEELGLRAGGGSSGPGGCGYFAPKGSNNSDEMGWFVLKTAGRKGASLTAKRTSGTNLPAIIG